MVLASEILWVPTAYLTTEGSQDTTTLASSPSLIKNTLSRGTKIISIHTYITFISALVTSYILRVPLHIFIAKVCNIVTLKQT